MFETAGLEPKRISQYLNGHKVRTIFKKFKSIFCAIVFILAKGLILFYHLGSRCLFHQHFTRTFFEQKCFVQLFSNYSLVL